MPTPVGHFAAGLATAWLIEAIPKERGRRLRMDTGHRGSSFRDRADLRSADTRGLWRTSFTGLPLACGLLAALPDLDLLVAQHRTWTHSLGAVALVWLAVAFCAGRSRSMLMNSAESGPTDRRRAGQRLRTPAACALAYATHVLLDWLGKDTSNPGGVMALWPLTNSFYRSGLDLFAEVSRRYWRPEEFIAGNLRSLIRELAILLPVAAAAWWTRRR